MKKKMLIFGDEKKTKKLNRLKELLCHISWAFTGFSLLFRTGNFKQVLVQVRFVFFFIRRKKIVWDNIAPRVNYKLLCNSCELYL